MAILVPIYMYHQVAPRSTPAFEPYLFVTPEALRRQVQQLQRAGWSLVTFSEAWQRIRTQTARPRVAVLTFDDLSTAFFEHALPVLRETNAKATAFLVTNMLHQGQAANLPGRPEPLPPEQVRALAAQDVEIGSHTETHRELTALDTHEMQTELRASREAIADLTGRACDTLCYPRGRFDGQVQKEAAAAGYTCACTTLRGNLHGVDDAFAVKRIRAHEGRGTWDLWYTTTRVFDWLHRKRTRRELEAFTSRAAPGKMP